MWPKPKARELCLSRPQRLAVERWLSRLTNSTSEPQAKGSVTLGRGPNPVQHELIGSSASSTSPSSSTLRFTVRLPIMLFGLSPQVLTASLVDDGSREKGL